MIDDDLRRDSEVDAADDLQLGDEILDAVHVRPFAVAEDPTAQTAHVKYERSFARNEHYETESF